MFTIFGANFSIPTTTKEIQARLSRLVPLTCVIAVVMLVEQAAASTTAQQTGAPGCQSVLDYYNQVGEPNIFYNLLQNGCMQLIKQITGKPLSVAGLDGVCADPLNCVSSGANGALNIAVDTTGDHYTPQY